MGSFCNYFLLAYGVCVYLIYWKTELIKQYSVYEDKGKLRLPETAGEKGILIGKFSRVKTRRCTLRVC